MQSDPKRRLLHWVVAALAVGAPSLHAQVTEEPLEQVDIWIDTRDLYDEAMRLFGDGFQEGALPVFGDFIAEVDVNRRLGGSEPPPDIAEMIVEVYKAMADANNNLGDDDARDTSLVALMREDPSVELDRGLISSSLVDRYEELRRQEIGSLLFDVVRLDAEGNELGIAARITSGRFTADEGGLLRLPVQPEGEPHIVRVEKPGYTTWEESVEIEAGDRTDVTVELTRSTAVVSIRSVQPRVEIFINGTPRGLTQPLQNGRISEFVVDDLAIGRYVVSARKDGFREPREIAFEVPELDDLALPNIFDLVPTGGVVVLEGLAEGTVVRVDGEVVVPTAGGIPSLSLRPGAYDLSFANRRLGLYEETVRLEDEATVVVQVSLRPALAFLGALGANETEVGIVVRTLQQRLAQLGRWSILDRTDQGVGVVDDAGISIEDLRAHSRSRAHGTIPWAELQRAASAASDDASLYFLAVLEDDVVSAAVEIYIWPAAPEPALPDHFAVRLDDLASSTRIAGLDREALQRRPTIGATLVDSPVSSRPLVVAVDGASAAARAGLERGDELVAVDGTAVASVAAFRDELEARVETHGETGQKFPVEVVSQSGDRRTVEFTMTLRWPILNRRNPDLLFSAAAVELSRLAQSENRTVQDWVLRLNRAVVFLQGDEHQAAINELRSMLIESPPESPAALGMAAYALGTAYQLVDSDRVVELARSELEKAASAEGARLGHEDGPVVGPRARARLEALP